jgi:hypothetical protein
MKDWQPISIRGTIPVGGRLFWYLGWQRCPSISAQMGIVRFLGKLAWRTP